MSCPQFKVSCVTTSQQMLVVYVSARQNDFENKIAMQGSPRNRRGGVDSCYLKGFFLLSYNWLLGCFVGHWEIQTLWVSLLHLTLCVFQPSFLCLSGSLLCKGSE